MSERRPLSVEVVVDRPSLLAEGPVWDDRVSRLLSVDIDEGLINMDALTGESTSHCFGEPTSAVIPRTSGGYVVALERELVLIDNDMSVISTLATLEPTGAIRLNDAKCDPRGRLWVGSTSTDGTRNAASLYRVEADASPTRVLRRVTISNGLGWNLDGTVMYYVDTATRALDAFDYTIETGEIARRRRITEFDNGHPDGIAVDAEGCIWVALWGGSSIQRHTPAGALDLEVRLPVSQVTSCCFGGNHYDTLFITTAARDLTTPEEHAGSIFAVRPHVGGLPPDRFAG